MAKKLTFKRLKEFTGKEVGLSEWMEITQDRINSFADCTEDNQWIHVDQEKARKSPLKGTVAHGYLLLSLLPYFNIQNEFFSLNYKMAVNYGLYRVRFIKAVKAGSRIRNRAVLREVTKRGFRQILLLSENTIEIEGEEKPAMVAETLALIYL